MEDQKVYYVLELQTYANGTGSVIPKSFSTLRSAESKYYSILSTAAVSSVYRHGAVLMTEEGFTIKQEIFTHLPEPAAED